MLLNPADFLEDVNLPRSEGATIFQIPDAVFHGKSFLFLPPASHQFPLAPFQPFSFTDYDQQWIRFHSFTFKISLIPISSNIFQKGLIQAANALLFTFNL